MASVKPPKYVRAVLVALQSRGYPAYLVGGCVRDMLLGVSPQSWDICTGAPPEQIGEIFPDVCRLDPRSGAVTVLIDSHEVEVSSFRSANAEAEPGEPDMVRFVGDLTADLSRRDFTMNAIALSADGMLSDPFGGVEDIRRQLIRCVGVPEERFAEDPLRMFRALRFSARLGFTVDLFTMEGIRAKAALAAELPAERVREELEKTLLTRSPETVRCALSCRDVFYGGEESQELRRILKSGECFSLKHLAVSGDDLLALGLRGRAVGEMLDFLLEYVMEYPDNNRRELLLSLAAGTEE